MDTEHEPEAAHRPHHKPLALVNARLIDPASGLDAFGGLVIANGTIADLGMHITEGSVEGAESLDCGGRTIAPGLIDMMVFSLKGPICEGRSFELRYCGNGSV